MPVSKERCMRCTSGALKIIKEVDVPRHINEKRRECINCMHWRSSNSVFGFCKCDGDLADYKNLRTWYNETCCYCILDIK